MSFPPALERAFRRLGLRQDADLDAIAPLPAARAGFLARVSEGAGPRSRWWLTAAVTAVVPVLAVAVYRLSATPAPLIASMRQSELPPQAWLSSAASERVPIEFSDGSQVTLQPNSRARIVALDADGATFAVESGEVSVRVVPRQRTNWHFTAGPYAVRVTGTAFSVRFSPERDLLQLELREGSVVVSGCALGEARPLRAGELLTASCHDGRFEIARGAKLPAASEPASAGLAPASAGSELPLEPKPAVSAPEIPRPAPDREAPSWEALARAGEYKRAFARVTALGFDAECERADAERLALLADVARFGGSSEQALTALSALRRRFAGGAAASVAAFAIARIHFDQRAQYAEAARWFRTYLKEQPRGSLSREAQGRLMETLVRLGDRDAARELARGYLSQNPSGPHARLARSLTEH